MSASDHLNKDQFKVHRAVSAEDAPASADAFIRANEETHPIGFGTTWTHDRGYAEHWATRGYENGVVVSGVTSHVEDPGKGVDGVEVQTPVHVTRMTHHEHSTGRVTEVPVEHGTVVYP